MLYHEHDSVLQISSTKRLDLMKINSNMKEQVEAIITYENYASYSTVAPNGINIKSYSMTVGGGWVCSFQAERLRRDC